MFGSHKKLFVFKKKKKKLFPKIAFRKAHSNQPFCEIFSNELLPRDRFCINKKSCYFQRFSLLQDIPEK